jgi:hypothetical protein
MSIINFKCIYFKQNKVLKKILSFELSNFKGYKIEKFFTSINKIQLNRSLYGGHMLKKSILYRSFEAILR